MTVNPKSKRHRQVPNLPAAIVAGARTPGLARHDLGNSNMVPLQSELLPRRRRPQEELIHRRLRGPRRAERAPQRAPRQSQGNLVAPNKTKLEENSAAHSRTRATDSGRRVPWRKHPESRSRSRKTLEDSSRST